MGLVGGGMAVHGMGELLRKGEIAICLGLRLAESLRSAGIVAAGVVARSRPTVVHRWRNQILVCADVFLLLSFDL